MTRTDMINTIRAGYPLGHKTTQAIADELELLGNHLKSCMLQIQEQEEQLRGLGAELAESEQHKRLLIMQNAELLARCDLLEAENMDRQEQSADMERCLAKALDHMVTVQSMVTSTLLTQQQLRYEEKRAQ